MRERPSNEELVILHRRARMLACKKGYAQIAEDFAGDYIMRILEGKSQHQLMDFAFIDYLRFTRGSKRAPPKDAMKHTDRLVGEDWDFFEEAHKRAEKQGEGALVNKISVEKAVSKLPKDEQEIIYAYFYEQEIMGEISEVLFVTESRVSQRLKIILAKLRRMLQG